jgi:hypothetical protein
MVLSRLWTVRAEGLSGTRYMEMQPLMEVYMVSNLVNGSMASLVQMSAVVAGTIAAGTENHITKPCLNLLTGL